jgi:hypothetical protein
MALPDDLRERVVGGRDMVVDWSGTLLEWKAALRRLKEGGKLVPWCGVSPSRRRREDEMGADVGDQVIAHSLKKRPPTSDGAVSGQGGLVDPPEVSSDRPCRGYS